MKKLLLLLLMLSCLTLTGCKKVTTKLSKDNYSEFLNVHYEATPSNIKGSYFTQIDDLVEIKSIKKRAKYEDVKVYVTVTFKYTIPSKPGDEGKRIFHFNHVITLNENGYGKEAKNKYLNLDDYLIPQVQWYVDMKVTRVTGSVTK